MKRLILTMAAAASLAAPLAAATPSAADAGRGGHHGGDGGDRGGDHGGRGGDRGGGWNREEHRGDRGGRWDGDRQGGRWEGDRGGGWSRGGDWDDRRHNGYWYNNRWFFGPPPQAYYGSPLYRPGYSTWRRGGYLPPYYSGWVVDDYWRYRLRRPPYGYHWVRIGGDYLLVANRSGLIFDIIAGGGF